MSDLNKELDKHIVSHMLSCPVCRAPLAITEDGRSVKCTGPRPHCFDGGGAGYLPLAPRHPGGGDAKEAVRARTAFLTRGYYQPAAETLCHLVSTCFPIASDRANADVQEVFLLDAGCGEGYYSCRLADRGYRVLGVDLSKFAVDAATKAARNQRTGSSRESRTVFAVGSVFELPVRDACADVLINLFAPCAPREFARVLKPGGYLIVAGAGECHLMGLKKLLYRDPYGNDPRRDLPGKNDPFLLTDRQNVTFSVTVSGRDTLEALFSMTPYYWRTDREGKERLMQTESLNTPVSFDFYIYRRV